MLPGKLNNYTLVTQGPSRPSPTSQHPLHTVHVAPCLSPSCFARDGLKHTRKTQSWDKRGAAQWLLCFWRVCRCVCTWLPLVRGSCLSGTLSSLHLSHSPRSSTCLSVWVSKPPCVSLCLPLFGLWVSLLFTHSQTSLPPADRMCAML